MSDKFRAGQKTKIQRQKRKTNIRLEYLNGASISQLCNKYQLSSSSIRKYLGDLILIRKRLYKSNCQDESISKDEFPQTTKSDIFHLTSVVPAIALSVYAISGSVPTTVNAAPRSKYSREWQEDQSILNSSAANRHKKEVLTLHRQGYTSNEIAKLAKISRRTVGRIFQWAGISPFTEMNKRKQDRMKMAVSMFDEGESVRAIANKIGVSIVTITDYLRETGYKLKQ